MLEHEGFREHFTFWVCSQRFVIEHGEHRGHVDVRCDGGLIGSAHLESLLVIGA
jgi:hypothetical protein